MKKLIFMLILIFLSGCAHHYFNACRRACFPHGMKFVDAEMGVCSCQKSISKKKGKR